LHSAASQGQVDVVKYLVEECGADVHAKENMGTFVMFGLLMRLGNAKVEKVFQLSSLIQSSSLFFGFKALFDPI
jgi:hypothetical protein